MSEISPPGKPWTNDSVHNTYELADKQRQTLLEKWDKKKPKKKNTDE